MNIFKYIFMLFFITALPLTTIAETIYKTVDESGAAVFSDERAPDAEKINVQPNVVDVDIPDIPTTAHPNTTRPKVMQTGHDKSSEEHITEIGSGTATAGNLKRKIRNRTNGEGINRPVARPAARSGGHR